MTVYTNTQRVKSYASPVYPGFKQENGTTWFSEVSADGTGAVRQRTTKRPAVRTGNSSYGVGQKDARDLNNYSPLKDLGRLRANKRLAPAGCHGHAS